LLQKLHQQSLFLLRMQREYLVNCLINIKKGVTTLCLSMNHELKRLSVNLGKDTSFQLRQFNLLLMGIEKNIINMSPLNVLKRGYSITLADGKPVKSVSQVKENDQIETIVFDGEITSLVRSTKKQHKNE